MSSQQYFNFLGSVWDLIPEADKQRVGELWFAYEQVVASSYQKFAEARLSIAVKNIVQYNTERWLPYTFDETNFIPKPAIFTSTQDLSLGVNLNGQYLIRISVDNGPEYEIDLRGADPNSTKIEEIVSRINFVVGFELARAVTNNSLLQLVSTTLGPNSKIKVMVPSDPLKDATEYVLGLLQSQLPVEVPEYPWVYKLPYDRVREIPSLRNAIRDDNLTSELFFNQDFTIELKFGLIRFKTQAPSILWAKRTLFDNETPWNNFGFLMDIYQPNRPSYKSVVQGLWFAFWMGPKPETLKRSLYLLFGLPTAQEISTVTKVTTTEIVTTSIDGIIRTFEVPIGLTPVVSVGDVVEKFQPLVDGIFVYDKVNNPGFITTEIGRSGIQRFLTDSASRGVGDTDETKALTMLEEHTFLPQISVDAFISPDIDLASVKTFLENIKPLSKAYLFQVIVGNFKDPMVMGESTSFDIKLDVTPNMDYNQTTFIDQATLLAYESSPNNALDLDSEGISFGDSAEIDVYHGVTLVDSFSA